MIDHRGNESLFNLDALERSNWRSRISQLKRELRGVTDGSEPPSRSRTHHSTRRSSAPRSQPRQQQEEYPFPQAPLNQRSGKPRGKLRSA